METCLAGESPESIKSVLVEKSVQLSNAECSLQTNMAELEKFKHELSLLQVSRRGPINLSSYCTFKTF